MPVVHVYQTAKTPDQKRDLIKGVTDVFGTALGYPAETVQVWIHEATTEDFGVAGKLASDA